MEPPYSLFNKLLGMVRHAWLVFLCKETPFRVKAALALGLLYAVSPYDLIPEWVPVLGMLDDLALAALLITWANRFRLPKS